MNDIQALPDLWLVGVRRWGGENTPVVIDGRRTCGTWSGHQRAGCIGLALDNRRGLTGLLHLTIDDALRLSDLLRALAAPEEPQP
ncbi:hypothetical protein ACGFZP_12925 [Kitasatospora sp. NPDC048239]|uniref:hypothetical protein n=1 Tax=Kitasatospora sp. NPDC048239 TaxID=3364046 RepID=UPI00371981CD